MEATLALRRAYTDICRGYSTGTWSGRTIYVKHLSHHDEVSIDDAYQEAFDRAAKRGIQTRTQRLEDLDAKKLWTKRDENELAAQKGYIDNLEKTKGKQFIKLQIDALAKQLAEATDKYLADLGRRERLIGLTCERRADERIQFHYVQLSFYEDASLAAPMFSAQDMRQIDDEDMDGLLMTYAKIIQVIDLQAIKRIALAPYFTGSFYLCAEHIYDFFARPMYTLTNHQVNLLSYGLYYKNMLGAHDVPADLRENPDKLEEYVNRTKNFNEAMSKAKVGDNQFVGVVGATKDDFKALNVQDGTQTMLDAANQQYTNSIDAAKGMGFSWA